MYDEVGERVRASVSTTPHVRSPSALTLGGSHCADAVRVRRDRPREERRCQSRFFAPGKPRFHPCHRPARTSPGLPPRP